MSFKSIVGHERQIAAIKRTLARDRVGTAYLFSGPEGVGKQAVALEFVRALLCPEVVEDSCDGCGSCRHVDAETHPDLLKVVPETSTLKIVQVRDARKFLGLTPSWGSRRAVLIDRAEAMNEAAANAMLKTLEEPPTGAVIILITSNPGSLPSTVLSRCQKVGFGLLADEQVQEVLCRQGWEKEAARAVMAMAEGSPGRAAILDSDEWKKIAREVKKMVANAEDGARGTLLEFVEAKLDKREKADMVLKILLGWTRRVLRSSLGVESGNPADVPTAMTGHSAAAAVDLADMIVETHRRIEGNCNVKLAMGSLLLRWEALE